MTELRNFLVFLESVEGDYSDIAETLMEGYSNYWSFARDMNEMPKQGYFTMATVSDEDIPEPARKKNGLLPNPTFAQNTMFSVSGSAAPTAGGLFF